MEVNQHAFVAAVSTNLVAAAVWIYKHDILGLVMGRDKYETNPSFNLHPSVPIVLQPSVTASAVVPTDHTDDSAPWEWTVAVLAVPLTYMVLLQLAHIPWPTLTQHLAFIPLILWGVLQWLKALFTPKPKVAADNAPQTPGPEGSPTHGRFHVLGATPPSRNKHDHSVSGAIASAAHDEAVANEIDLHHTDSLQTTSPTRGGSLIGPRAQHMFTFDVIATRVVRAVPAPLRRPTERNGEKSDVTSETTEFAAPSTDKGAYRTSVVDEPTQGETEVVEFEEDASE